MLYPLSAILLAALLAAYSVLLAYEARAGHRLLAGPRQRFDAAVGRLEQAVRHVDWGAFSAEVARTAVLRLVHDIVHGTLVAVRTVERILTRIVKTLREGRTVAAVQPRRSVRERLSDAYTYLRQAVRQARKDTGPQPPDER